MLEIIIIIVSIDFPPCHCHCHGSVSFVLLNLSHYSSLIYTEATEGQIFTHFSHIFTLCFHRNRVRHTGVKK